MKADSGNQAISVTACIITYNQEAIISRAIEGALSQKYIGDYRILIADDASTDGTAAVCRYYQQRHPDLIRLQVHTRNLGTVKNWVWCMQQVTTDYVALCEGDDYWTDPLKLQKQVDTLEANPAAAVCWTNVHTINEVTHAEGDSWYERDTVELNEIIAHNKWITASAMLRCSDFLPLPASFSKMPFFDWGAYQLALYRSNRVGKILPDVTAVYNIHQNCQHSHLYFSDTTRKQAFKEQIAAYRVLRKYLYPGDTQRKQMIDRLIADRKGHITSYYRKEGKPLMARYFQYFG